MKSGIRLLCLLLCIILLVSCQKQQNANEDNSEKTENTEHEKEKLEIPVDSATICYAYETKRYPLWWVWKESKNVFTGKLVKFDEDLSKNDQERIYYAKRGNVNLTIEVDGVYKGDHIVGTTVKERYDYGVFSDINNPGFWEEGARYLFIFLDYDDNTASIPTNSVHSALKLDDSGKYEMIDGAVDTSFRRYSPDSEPNDIFALFNVKLNIENVLLNAYKHFYSYFEKAPLKNGYIWNPGENFEYTLEDFYEIAEDVYYGEIIEKSIFVDHNDLLYCAPRDLYKIKVKVMTVYKGDLKPGEIIEDITCLEYGSQMNGTDEFDRIEFGSRVNTQFFFTGGALDLGYSLDSENSAS